MKIGMKKLFFIMFLIVMVITAACSTIDNTGNPGKNYLVGYKEGVSEGEIKSMIEKNNGTILKHYSNFRVFKVKLRKADIEILAKEKLIRYVEEDKKVETK
jgi:hypothetical protein